MPNFRELSKGTWSPAAGENVSIEAINAGSFQRIADATEKMAASYDDMRRSRDAWRSAAEVRERENKSLAYQIRALRGVITRLQKKHGAAEALSEK